eukprot:3988959-Amphidinium_carterae.1
MRAGFFRKRMSSGAIAVLNAPRCSAVHLTRSLPSRVLRMPAWVTPCNDASKRVLSEVAAMTTCKCSED